MCMGLSCADFKIGLAVQCKIGNDVVDDAKLQLWDGEWYICQDIVGGKPCGEKLGYQHSWTIESGTEAALDHNNVSELRLNGTKPIKPVVVEAPTIEYSEWIRLAYDKLCNNDIPVKRVYLNKLESERVSAKAELNQILGLTAENQYRVTLTQHLTESQFVNSFPATIKFIKHVVGADVFSVTANRIYLANGTTKKLSKVLSKHFETWHSDAVSGLHYDSCNELGIKNNTSCYVSSLIDSVLHKRIVVSTNIYDMLTSSTDASYSSCYRMDGGEYFNGNLAYIRDSFTCITFVYSDDIKRKVGRSWAYVFPDQFKLAMPGRVYGSMYQTEYRIVRKYIERQISEHYGVRPYWKFNPNVNYYASGSHSNGRGGPVYFDYDRVGMAYHKFKAKDSNPPFIVFDEAQCLKCGKITSYPEGGICEDCDSVHHCNRCGDHIYDDNAYEDDDGNTICSYCYDEYYSECDRCGNTTNREDMYWIESNDTNVCSKCCASHYSECDECNSLFHNGDLTETANNHSVCSGCLDEHYSECSECGGLIRNDDSTYDDDGETYCRECVPAKVEHDALPF